jgi:hypothetical protein
MFSGVLLTGKKASTAFEMLTSVVWSTTDSSSSASPGSDPSSSWFSWLVDDRGWKREH